LRLGAGRPDCLRCVLHVRDQPHSAPAPTCTCLDKKWHAQLLRFGQQGGVGLVIAAIARQCRHTGTFGGCLGGNLGAHNRNRIRRRANISQTCRLHRAGELWVFGQKAITGVDRACVGGMRRGQNGLYFQIAFGRGRRAYTDREIGLCNKKRVAVGLRKHRHSFKP